MSMELLQRMKSLGISVSLDDGKLRVGTHGAPLSNELRSEIKNNKAQLISLLKAMRSSGVTVASERIVPTKRGEGEKVALSYSQQRLWFIDQLHSGSAEYNMVGAFTVSADFDLHAAQKAIHHIIERHEVLRTVYLESDGQAYQQVKNEFSFNIDESDLSMLSSQCKQRELEKLLDQEAQQAFCLITDLMVRARFIQLNPRASKTDDFGVLTFNIHHIASDGWSIELFLTEFVIVYDAVRAGKTWTLPHLPIQYADYVNWQQSTESKTQIEQQLCYWESQLAELPSVHNLSLDKSRTESHSGTGKIITQHISKEVAQALISLAKDLNMTAFMVVHAALALVLSAYSYSKDIVVGTPIANRKRSELEHLIGFFSNTLVLRTRTDFTSLLAYLQNIKQVHVNAQENQDVPFDLLVERLNVPRDLAYTPLFQILLNTEMDYGVKSLENGQKASLRQVGLSPRPISHTSAKFDIEVNVIFSEQGAQVYWLYDTALFSEERMSKMLGHLNQTLKNLSDLTLQEKIEQAQLSELSMLSHTEQRELYRFNQNQSHYCAETSIHDLFCRQAEVLGSKIAAVCGKESISYRELDERSEYIAQLILAKAKSVDTLLVGICLERSLNMVVGLLGILKAGAAYVPIDATYPQNRIDYILTDAKPQVVICQATTREKVKSSEAALLEMDRVQFNQPQMNTATSQLAVDINWQSKPAYVIYTSGSTGTPKGVMVSHGNLSALIHWAQGQFSKEELSSVLAATSLNFDLSAFELFVPLCLGHQCVIVENGISLLHDDVASISLINTVPSVMSTLLEHDGIPDSVQVINLAGEPLSMMLTNSLLEKKKCKAVYNLYGPSEDTTYSTAAKFETMVQQAPHIGKVISNSAAYVVSPQLNLVPFGEVGELCLSGAGLTLGYLGKAELTKEKFIYHPSLECIIYRTGDLVRYLPCGNFEYLGRIDEQVKVRGFRVEVGEIVHHLEQFNVVESAIVMARENHNNVELIAFVKLCLTSETVDQQSLKNELQQVLPDYMVPAQIAIVERWPLLSNGKVDKKSLLSLDVYKPTASFVTPSTDMEQQLVDIWSQLLNKQNEHICCAMSFFDLGGNSLLMVRLISKVKQLLGISLDIRALYKVKNIQHLAQICEGLERQKHLTQQLQQHELDNLEELEF